VSWHGVRTVAALELRQRVRTSRWPVVLGLWAFTIASVALLTYLAMTSPQARMGEALYDVVLFFVLGLGMLVVPSLTATSVNGDRERGVLATLQTTLLTPADIVLGKLLAAWAVACAFLVTALPFLFWAWLAGGIPVGRAVVSLLVLLLVLAVVCAVGLMFSSLTARPVTSAVLTYLAMGALVFGTLIGFSLSVFLVTEQEPVRVHGVPDSWWDEHAEPEDPRAGPQPGVVEEPTPADCTTFTRVEQVVHTERIWWMLPLNPFVVVADAAPSGQVRRGREYWGGFTPLRWISEGVREARRGPTHEGVRQECWYGEHPEVPPGEAGGAEEDREESPVWPYGLAFLGAVGAGATVVATRRLRTPVSRLPSGTRIA
jgi:ABC-2 type transport system permease protein